MRGSVKHMNIDGWDAFHPDCPNPTWSRILGAGLFGYRSAVQLLVVHEPQPLVNLAVGEVDGIVLATQLFHARWTVLEEPVKVSESMCSWASSTDGAEAKKLPS